MKTLVSVLLVAGLVASGVAPGAADPVTAQQAAYTLVELPVPAGYSNAQAVALNDSGVIVGEAYRPSDVLQDLRAVMWVDGRAELLAQPEGFHVTAPGGINERGTVVGVGYRPLPSGVSMLVPLVWSRGGAVTELPLSAGHAEGAAIGVNDVGTVVGWTGTTGGPTYPVVWRRGVPTVLSQEPGVALAVNNHGVVIGYSNTGGARIWAGGVESTPAVPPGSVPGSVQVRALNDRGVIVGGYFRTEDASGAALMWRGGDLQVVPVPSDVFDSAAVGVNSRGDVVGTIGSWSGQGWQPAVWRDGTMETLARPPRTSDAYAEAVNDSGLIVGRGWLNGTPEDPRIGSVALAWMPAT